MASAQAEITARLGGLSDLRPVQCCQQTGDTKYLNSLAAELIYLATSVECSGSTCLGIFMYI